MGGPLAARDVEDLERASGVGLPEEYRRFVCEDANGGERSPEYGLVRLGEVPQGYDRRPRERLQRMRRPFPPTASWVWQDEEPLAGERKALRERAWDGTVVLGHDGSTATTTRERLQEMLRRVSLWWAELEPPHRG